MPRTRPRVDASSGYRLSIDDEELEIPPGRPLLIGRAGDCALQLKGGLVSRHHARLAFDGTELTIEDLQSRNGVTVNGARITGAALLGHGDVIGIGLRSILIFDAGMSERPEHLSTLPPAGEQHALTAAAVEPPSAADSPTLRVCLNDLSPRERDVLELTVRGFTHKEMAQRLFVSVKTVETYRARLAEKLGCQSRAELVTYAIASGILRDSSG